MTKFFIVLVVVLVVPYSFADDPGDSDSENTSTVTVQMDESRKLIEDSDYESAISKLEKIIQSDQRNADAWNLLGFSHRKAGDIDRAKRAYVKALEYNPEHKGALEYQGELYITLNDYELARANQQKLIKLCPDGCEELTDLTESLETTDN